MPIIPLYGHERARERLADAADRGMLPASLLLLGPPGIGKQRLALWLGQRLLCTRPNPPCGSCQSCRYVLELAHPDLHWYFPVPRPKDAESSPEHLLADYAEVWQSRLEGHGLYARPSGLEGLFVATSKLIIQHAAVSPALGACKVFVVGEADRMVPQEGAEQAANAFLKLLEEPPADTYLILTTSEPGALLPTIRSRVVTVRVAPLSDGDVADFLEDERVGAALRERGVGGSLEERVRLAAGAPGRLLDMDAEMTAAATARALLEAAVAPERARRHQVALAQGVAGARGRFTDALEALTALLHERTRAAATRGDEGDAMAAARGIDAVERAKEYAHNNVAPQLIAAGLIDELSRLWH